MNPEKRLKKKRLHTSYRPFFRLIRRIVKIFKKKPFEIDEYNEPSSETAIYISNHSGASGPLTLSLYAPTFIVPWGTHEMVGTYKERWNYLYYIFYQQKLGYRKTKAWILASLFAIISKMLYRGMQLIPTFPDTRLKSTINLSIRYLEIGANILIFPEDSTSGYHEELLHYNAGFILLSQAYFKKIGVDLPIYTLYYSKKDNAYIVGKKKYLQPLLNEGKSRGEIAEYFKNLTNELGEELKKKLRSRT